MAFPLLNTTLNFLKQIITSLPHFFPKEIKSIVIFPLLISLSFILWLIFRSIKQRIPLLLHWLLWDKEEKIYKNKIEETGVFIALKHCFLCFNLYAAGLLLHTVDYFSFFYQLKFSLLWCAVIIENMLYFYFIAASCLLLNAGIELSLLIYEKSSAAQKISLMVLGHITKLIVWLGGSMLIFGQLAGLDIPALFTKVATAAAVLIYIFREYLIGFLISLQITLQDLVRIGDWITLPKFRADGTVEKITITIVKVRNFDKTFSVIPTHALFAEGLQNWRGMQQSGGRRIKRSIHIDQSSVQLYTEEKQKLLSKHPLLHSFMQKESSQFNTVTTSNLTLFRHYLTHYLYHHPKIASRQFTFLIRQLQPTPYGLPLELYIFTSTTNWVAYEAAQSAIFEHIYAILPLFELHIYQVAHGSISLSSPIST